MTFWRWSRPRQHPHTGGLPMNPSVQGKMLNARHGQWLQNCEQDSNAPGEWPHAH